MDEQESETRRLLGLAVRSIREAKGIKLDVFATRAGINFGYLSRVERGQRNPSIDVIERLAAALEVPVDAISYVLPVEVAS